MLFINTNTMEVEKDLIVGLSLWDFTLDRVKGRLFVSNDGAGDAKISVIDLKQKKRTEEFPLPSHMHLKSVVKPINIVFSPKGVLYWNGGFMFNGTRAFAMDADSGEDLGEIAQIKTNMPVNKDGTRLWGQYIYSGNLGEMGVFDISSGKSGGGFGIVDRRRYPPYPINKGWSGARPYVLSGDGRYLIYDNVLFNSGELSRMIGKFPENIYALTSDGHYAMGATTVWDTSTFEEQFRPTAVQKLPVWTSLMGLSPDESLLYAYDASRLRILAVKLFLK